MSSPHDLATLRRHYEQAAADKAAGEKFYQLMSSYQGNEALPLAYKAASEAIRARDASMFNKLTYAQAATRIFEQAVAADSNSAEVRFLRFSVESNIPGFLGLSPHVEEDRQFLLDALFQHPQSGLDAEAFTTVRGFLVGRGHVSAEQAESLEQIAV
jgi:hypothetical protein